MNEQPTALRLADALEDDLEDYRGQSLPRLWNNMKPCGWLMADKTFVKAP